MSSKHIANKFFDRIDRIGVRLPDDVKQQIFEYAKKNDLLGAEYVKDIVLPFMRSKDGHSEEKSWRETMPRNKEEWKKRIEEEAKMPDQPPPLSEFEIKSHNELAEKGIWCYYATFLQTEDLVYCDNPKKKNLPRDKRLPIAVCYKCGQRRKAMREKHKTQQNGDHVRDGYRCTLKGETFPKLEELPCMNDLICPKKNCMQKIDSLLKTSKCF